MTLPRHRHERRRWARATVPEASAMRVALHGFDERGRRVDAIGEPINVSRGGVLARTESRLRVDAHCLGHFRRYGNDIYPEYAYGRVIRRTEAGGAYLVVLEFDRPLETVELTERAARTPAHRAHRS